MSVNHAGYRTGRLATIIQTATQAESHLRQSPEPRSEATACLTKDTLVSSGFSEIPDSPGVPTDREHRAGQPCRTFRSAPPDHIRVVNSILNIGRP